VRMWQAARKAATVRRMASDGELKLKRLIEE
jgi:hypothetical protein